MYSILKVLGIKALKRILRCIY